MANRWNAAVRGRHVLLELTKGRVSGGLRICMPLTEENLSYWHIGILTMEPLSSLSVSIA